MTPDTCPHCGAPSASSLSFACGSEWVARDLCQSPECARYVRTRIAHLRRMADLCDWRMRWIFARGNTERKQAKYARLRAACLREIDRLRGGA